MADGMAEEKEREIGSEAARDTKRDWTYENKLKRKIITARENT